MPEPVSRPDVPDDFDGCARECRKAGTHTLVWGRCEHAPEPTPPSKDDLRGLLIAAGLTSHMVTLDDGYPSVAIHSNKEAADRALAVFAEWLPARDREIERQVRERVAAEILGSFGDLDPADDYDQGVMDAAKKARGES